MCNGDLKRRAKLEIELHGGIGPLSRAIGVNPGVIYRVKQGGNSPTLRRLWGIRKGNRVRLSIDCDRATIARFDAMRGEMTRADYLLALLNLAAGNGELPY